MANWAPILQYRDYWDVPRIFLTRFQDKLYLFDCAFDDVTEDFPNTYQVYRMPELEPEVLSGSWYGLDTKATAYLGEVPIDCVRFDATRRKEIDTAVLEELTAKAKAG
jgi:hypothetical protein